MLDAPQGGDWTQCEQRLDACTGALSAAEERFRESLRRREDLYASIRAAEKAKDYAALAEFYKQAVPLEAEYDATARAFTEAHRNLEIACQDCKRAVTRFGVSPPDPALKKSG